MPENKSRYVLLCQHLLAFGTVVALAAPAASVVTLDIVAPTPVAPAGTGAAPPGAGSLVATQPVRPDITEVPVSGVDPAALEVLADGAPARSVTGLQLAAAGQDDGKELAALTAPEPVSGYATVGVTWEEGEQVADDDITVSVRSLKNGTWSDWQEIEYHDDHAPDPGSEEARRARPGTDPIVVGDVDEVQVKAETTSGEVPADMKLALVDPGKTADPVVEKPAIDTAELGADDTAALSAADLAADVDPNAPGADAVLSSAADVTPKPKIYSRAQWGADEGMRDRSSLHYFEIHAGFVHHTVNANNYSRGQVPALLRGIYAYHTQSKHWSDIGYNFIVDRFGRIWEGRYGGVARPVVGAHTLGYNENSFAMSALGNFETARPSSAMLDAYGRLFAWKLSLHGIDASSTRQWVGKKYFRAINGHRDAGQTACPGKYLYARLPTIRSLAAQYQKPFTGRAKQTDISGSPWPDLVVRDKATRKAYVIQTAGQVDFQRGRRADRAWRRMDLVTAGRDLTGDGIPDMVGRIKSSGMLAVYPGTAQGTFGAGIKSNHRFANHDQLTGVGDLTGDRKADLVARDRTTKKLYVYPGRGNGGFRRRLLLASSWGDYNLTSGVGDMTGDGKNDLVARDRSNRLWLVPGRTRRSLGTPVRLPHAWGSFDLIAGMGDLTNDGLPDLVVRKRRSGLVYIYPGNGRSGIGQRYGAFSGFSNVNVLASVGDLTGNSGQDLVGRVGARLLVFANTGGKNIAGVVNTGSVFTDTNLVLNVGDWNGDGHGDVMTRASSGRMLFRAGNGRSRFAAPVRAARGGKRWGRIRLVAAVGDVTGDGFPDLMGQPPRGGMKIYPGNGVNGFAADYAAHSSVSSDVQAGAGLWNSDGSPDSIMRRSDGSLMLYPGNGPGGLMSPRKIGGASGRYDWLHGAGDVNGDGRPDLIARERSTGSLWLLPGNGSGFDPRRFIGSGFGRFDLGG
ncbi:MAG TPA: FG-GAP-like repeat-containing protein [Nocardioidaceae bacterium]|nr:FG-GAP-like repeat-containing protein [Nocardioidaceae bacterium]